MTMWQLTPGVKAIISNIQSNEEMLLQRLQELGLSAGQEIECVKRLPFDGPRVYALSDCLFSLEKSMAEKIVIKV